MVSRRLRSRSYRRIKVTTPGGVTKTRYERRPAKTGHCAATGEVLKGTKTNGPRSSKRPTRPFGGMLSSSAMREYFKFLVRDR
jgi:ribosomal protein L34E